jgi:hypothetical protein
MIGEIDPGLKKARIVSCSRVPLALFFAIVRNPTVSLGSIPVCSTSPICSAFQPLDYSSPHRLQNWVFGSLTEFTSGRGEQSMTLQTLMF